MPSERVIKIERDGQYNRVYYHDVLVGSFLDGDYENLAVIIDGAIDVYIERTKKRTVDDLIQFYEMGHTAGKKGIPFDQKARDYILNFVYKVIRC